VDPSCTCCLDLSCWLVNSDDRNTGPTVDPRIYRRDADLDRLGVRYISINQIDTDGVFSIVILCKRGGDVGTVNVIEIAIGFKRTAATTVTRE
jgi:hypothetical protein